MTLPERLRVFLPGLILLAIPIFSGLVIEALGWFGLDAMGLAMVWGFFIALPFVVAGILALVGGIFAFAIQQSHDS